MEIKVLKKNRLENIFFATLIGFPYLFYFYLFYYKCFSENSLFEVYFWAIVTTCVSTFTHIMMSKVIADLIKIIVRKIKKNSHSKFITTNNITNAEPFNKSPIMKNIKLHITLLILFAVIVYFGIYLLASEGYTAYIRVGLFIFGFIFPFHLFINRFSNFGTKYNRIKDSRIYISKLRLVVHRERRNGYILGSITSCVCGCLALIIFVSTVLNESLIVYLLLLCSVGSSFFIFYLSKKRFVRDAYGKRFDNYRILSKDYNPNIEVSKMESSKQHLKIQNEVSGNELVGLSSDYLFDLMFLAEIEKFANGNLFVKRESFDFIQSFGRQQVSNIQQKGQNKARICYLIYELKNLIVNQEKAENWKNSFLSQLEIKEKVYKDQHSKCRNSETSENNKFKEDLEKIIDRLR